MPGIRKIGHTKIDPRTRRSIAMLAQEADLIFGDGLSVDGSVTGIGGGSLITINLADPSGLVKTDGLAIDPKDSGGMAIDTDGLYIVLDTPAHGLHMSLGASGLSIDDDYVFNTGDVINGELEILSTTTPQLKLSYDGSNNATFAVSATGDLTITVSGGDISIGDENLITTGDLTCGELNVIYGTDNRIFYETFEEAGYVESGWAPTTDADCTVDEDADVADVSSPDGWGDQCCKFDVDSTSGGNDAYIQNDPAVIPDLADTWISFEFVVTASTLVNGNSGYLFWTRTSVTNYVWLVSLRGTAAGHRLAFLVEPTGSGYSTFYSDELDLNTIYKVEVKWDSTNNECIWKLNGVVQDTIILSGTHQTGIDKIYCGIRDVTATKDLTVYMDNITIDDTGWSDATFNLYNNILSNSAGIIDFDDEWLVTTGNGIFNELTLTTASQDYLFTSRAANLALQSQTSG